MTSISGPRGPLDAACGVEGDRLTGSDATRRRHPNPISSPFRRLDRAISRAWPW